MSQEMFSFHLSINSISKSPDVLISVLMILHAIFLNHLRHKAFVYLIHWQSNLKTVIVTIL